MPSALKRQSRPDPKPIDAPGKRTPSTQTRTSTKKSSTVSSIASKPTLDRVQINKELNNPVRGQLDTSVKTKSRTDIKNAAHSAELREDKAPLKGEWGTKKAGLAAAPRPVTDLAPRTDKQFFIKALNSTLTLDYSPDMTIGEVRAKIRQKQPHLTDDFSSFCGEDDGWVRVQGKECGREESE
ncbi:MAG: hypothetical protein AAF449_02165 [Myxococcota bacterium]